MLVQFPKAVSLLSRRMTETKTRKSIVSTSYDIRDFPKVHWEQKLVTKTTPALLLLYVNSSKCNIHVVVEFRLSLILYSPLVARTPCTRDMRKTPIQIMTINVFLWLSWIETNQFLVKHKLPWKLVSHLKPRNSKQLLSTVF